MNPFFPFSSCKYFGSRITWSCRSLLAAFAALAVVPLVVCAQAPAKVVKLVAFTMPTELESALEGFHSGAQALIGSSMDSPKAAAFANNVAVHLRKNGYPFANAVASADPDKSGKLVVTVSPGKIGVANVDGNSWLSEEGILESLGWDQGETFHYGKFHAAAAALNSHRFVKVDSKLRPRRGDDGGIIVDADFTIEDEVPLIFTANVANDGARQSSGWRAGLGLEWWEPFAQGDRLALSWLADPEDLSQLSSYSMQYFGESGEKVDWIVFGGYSDSEYDNVVSSADLDVNGEGVHFGFAGTHTLRDSSAESLAVSVGLTYLNVSNSMTFYGSSYSDETLALLLPRIGLQGTLKEASGLPGKTFWSVAVLSDAGIADDADLATQRPGVSSGFLAGQFGLSTLQPLDLFGDNAGLYLNLAGQVANDPLPVSLQKAIGGARTVRGYREREAFGDHGFHVNAELRLTPIKASFLEIDGSLQTLFFYDYGYVSSEQSLAGSDDSIGMQSFGAGMIGSFERGLGLNLHVGVPIEGTPQSDDGAARAHFELNYRF